MERKITNIGGQAVIEGVMMRGPQMYTLAVRTPDNEIKIQDVSINSSGGKYKFLKLPLIRGVAAFINSLVLGTQIMGKSAEFSGAEVANDEELTGFDKFLYNTFGDRTMDIVMGASVVLSLVLGVSLFMLLPTFLSSLIKDFFGFGSRAVLSALEGIIKVIIFLAYMFLISRIKDIQRVFMYHGAEHKTIICFELGDELTVENVRNHSRLHKRCGTSFLFFVILVSVFLFMFIQTDTLALRAVTRVLLTPLVAGISYELIRLAGKTDSKLLSALSAPGIKLQLLTTREPDDAQIEVAIAALKGVLAYETRASGETGENC